eukprot:TRINITY_DN108_c1_g1_i1.p1 TRINITY_DN108_c1_g1~~TRINITY_DN108_c1_g1_i1.p1  ORF type:complete len:533 (+),score=152.32 TRINITY_DN108_c1_g1_i1:613-2211(+)
MLGFLLFAAALEVDLRALSRIRTTVFALSVFSTAISTLLVSALTYLLLLRIAPMDYMWCLLFGAIVSPTDPVAVVAILNDKPDLIPLSTRYFVLGESLFNDAVGVVLYLGFVETVEKPDMPVVEVLRVFARGFVVECASGIAIGVALSWLAYSAMLAVDDALLEVTISIVLVSNINLACSYFHASIPLASVTAGLLIGNYGVADAMSEASSALFHQLWSFLDETLNSVLFLLIGAADLFWRPQDIGLAPTTAIVVGTVCISLFARALSVATPLLVIVGIESVTNLRLRHKAVRYRGGTIGVLTWGGMRGGISIALALGVPDAFVQHALPGHLSPGQLIFLMTFYARAVFPRRPRAAFLRSLCTSSKTSPTRTSRTGGCRPSSRPCRSTLGTGLPTRASAPTCPTAAPWRGVGGGPPTTWGRLGGRSPTLRLPCRRQWAMVTPTTAAAATTNGPTPARRAPRRTGPSQTWSPTRTSSPPRTSTRTRARRRPRQRAAGGCNGATRLGAPATRRPPLRRRRTPATPRRRLMTSSR